MGVVCERFPGITPLNFGELTVPQIEVLTAYIERHPVPICAMVELPKERARKRRR